MSSFPASLLLLRVREEFFLRPYLRVASSSSVSSANNDHYATLGLTKTASSKEIKAAYYKLSKQYHPDANQADPSGAAQKFHKVADAYEVLGSEEKRRAYDISREIRRPASWTSNAGVSRERSAATKRYEDIDIDYKDFEHFQRNARSRKRYHSHWQMPDEFYAEFGGGPTKSVYEEDPLRSYSIHKDWRAAAREEEEARRELERREEEFRKRYPVPTFEQVLQEKRERAAAESRRIWLSMLGVSTGATLLLALLFFR